MLFHCGKKELVQFPKSVLCTRSVDSQISHDTNIADKTGVDHGEFNTDHGCMVV